jgi:acyl-CoA synthetase (AMP-forming)/AMP-acid ligase II
VKELVYPRLLRPTAERLAGKTGFIDHAPGGVVYEGTYGEHLDRVLRLSNALGTQLGVKPGDRFAVFAMNGHQFIELYHAALFGAGIINPVNIRFNAAELAYVVNESESNVVFTDPVFATIVADAMTNHGARIDRIVVIGGTEGDGVTGTAGAVSYEDVVAAGEPVAPPEPEEDDPVVLMYTGGTTGLPKGALLEQRAELLNAYHVGISIGLDEERRFLFQSPMFHAAMVAAVLALPASGGVSVSIPLFDPGMVLDVTEREQIDTTLVIPVMLSMLEQHPSFSPQRLSSLRQLVYGASPISTSLLQRWLKLLPDTDFIQGYGMTEAGSVLTLLGPREHREDGSLLDAAGLPVLGVELCITDTYGNRVGTGEAGEVCARGGNLMREYWKKPEETAEAFRDGWYRTGDIGYLDTRGYLHLTDRAKDMIVTGGENVYSTEVENALAQHPAVDQVAVIGIPSDKWGEAVHAVVVLKQGMTATAQELIDFARKLLPGFKVPKSVEFSDQPLPLSGAFKPLKRELRRRYIEQHHGPDQST